MDREKLARDYFYEGYNCSQAIVLAFSDLLKLDKSELLKIASVFGGGMGRLREVCGSVSGMLIVLGLLYGYDTLETGEVKKNLYERVQELALKFEKDNGSIICRELLGLNIKHDDPTPSQRTGDFYHHRPCQDKIGYAARILEEYINNHPYKV